MLSPSPIPLVPLNPQLKSLKKKRTCALDLGLTLKSFRVSQLASQWCGAARKLPNITASQEWLGVLYYVFALEKYFRFQLCPVLTIYPHPSGLPPSVACCLASLCLVWAVPRWAGDDSSSWHQVTVGRKQVSIRSVQISS